MQISNVREYTNRFAGKTALVTGASRGIGAVTARRLAAEGARVVVHYGRDERAAHAVVQEIERDGGTAAMLGADLSEFEEARGLVDAAVERFGGLHIVVNNAGIAEFVEIDKITQAHVHKLFALNVEGPIAVTIAAARVLPRGGRIVNVSSVAARGGARRGVYGATKAALESMTRSFAADLGPRGITVNCVAPGTTRTEMASQAFGAAFESMAESTALGRLGEPLDVAAAIAYLASDDAGWMTGAIVPVDGGRLAL